MRNNKIYIIITILFLIALLFIYQYVFGIYEVTYSVDHKNLFADNTSTVTIKVIPVNSFGWKAPFRESSAIFNITEGGDLIEILTNDAKRGALTIKAKDKPGKVVIRVKSEHSLLPTEIEITIEPNAV